MNSDLFGIELGKRIGLVHSLCLKYSQDKEKAEDLAGHVLLLAWEKRNTYADQGKMNSWLGRIVYHEFVNHYRKDIKTDICSLNFLSELTGDAVECGVVNKEEDANDYLKESAYRAKQCLKNYLNAYKSRSQHLTVFNLRVEGYSYEEISEELNIPLSKVKASLFRIREFAKAELSDIYQQRQKVNA